jgi:hypothetical protein
MEEQKCRLEKELNTRQMKSETGWKLRFLIQLWLLIIIMSKWNLNPDCYPLQSQFNQQQLSSSSSCRTCFSTSATIYCTHSGSSCIWFMLSVEGHHHKMMLTTCLCLLRCCWESTCIIMCEIKSRVILCDCVCEWFRKETKVSKLWDESKISLDYGQERGQGVGSSTECQCNNDRDWVIVKWMQCQCAFNKVI